MNLKIFHTQILTVYTVSAYYYSKRTRGILIR